jgi:hypothetical protein
MRKLLEQLWKFPRGSRRSGCPSGHGRLAYRLRRPPLERPIGLTRPSEQRRDDMPELQQTLR